MNINIPNPDIPNQVMLDWLERDRTSPEVHVFVVGGTPQERLALAEFIGTGCTFSAVTIDREQWGKVVGSDGIG